MIATARYLRDILSYLDDVEAFTADGRAAFMADRKTQYAVIRAYEVIGEIVKRLPDDMLAQQPAISWARLKAFRDFLAHHYERVILANVWQAVEDLPDLRAAVDALLAEIDEQEGQASE